MKFMKHICQNLLEKQFPPTHTEGKLVGLSPGYFMDQIILGPSGVSYKTLLKRGESFSFQCELFSFI